MKQPACKAQGGWHPLGELNCVTLRGLGGSGRGRVAEVDGGDRRQFRMEGKRKFWVAKVLCGFPAGRESLSLERHPFIVGNWRQLRNRKAMDEGEGLEILEAVEVGVNSASVDYVVKGGVEKGSVYN